MYMYLCIGIVYLQCLRLKNTCTGRDPNTMNARSLSGTAIHECLSYEYKQGMNKTHLVAVTIATYFSTPPIMG